MEVVKHFLFVSAIFHLLVAEDTKMSSFLNIAKQLIIHQPCSVAVVDEKLTLASDADRLVESLMNFMAVTISRSFDSIALRDPRFCHLNVLVYPTSTFLSTNQHHFKESLKVLETHFK